jgi:hypothetical protein
VATLPRPDREVAGGTPRRKTKGRGGRVEMNTMMNKGTKGSRRTTEMSNVMDNKTKGNGGSMEMNNMMDMVDSCMKVQKDFMDSCVKAQKDGMERWAEATKKMQEPFLNMGGTQEGPMKDILGFYNTCMATMTNSAKAVSDESGKIQETWKSAAEKQMEMSREMMQKMTGFFQPVCAQK